MALSPPTGIKLGIPPGRPSNPGAARSVLAGKGALRRAEIRCALASSAPLRLSIFATGGSGGNPSGAASVQRTRGLSAAKLENAFTQNI